MARDAASYPVTFPYLATGDPYSPSRPHRGNDRRMPTGTPVVIAGLTIGLSGNTGLSTGPHLHTQAGTDLACQKTFKPDVLEFKAGKVVNLRTVDQLQWGKFVTVQVGKRFITYAHLSKVLVKVGQVIKEVDMFKGKTAERHYKEAVAWKGKAKGLGKVIENQKKEVKRLQDVSQAQAAQVEKLNAEIGQLKKDAAAEIGFWSYIKAKLGIKT